MGMDLALTMVLPWLCQGIDKKHRVMVWGHGYRWAEEINTREDANMQVIRSGGPVSSEERRCARE
jgi:hypothetical protein